MIKTKIACIFFIFFINLDLFSQSDHVQDAHQHIVKQAWELLKQSYPNYNYIEMNNWIGDNQHDGPWSFGNTGRVVAGAYREDDEDPIYNYTCWGVASSTHFWGVGVPWNPNQYSPYHLLECQLANCNVPGSAWNKLDLYTRGGWELKKDYRVNNESYSDVTFQRWDGLGTYTVRSWGSTGMMYEGLIEGPRNLYSTGYMKITGRYVNELAEWEAFKPPLEVRLTGSQKYFCYEILGRMAHLIQDQSVPAHTHLDAHPDGFPCFHGDSYETRMGGQYQNYNSQNCGGTFINPYLQYEYHPVFYLAFIQNQIARRFPSNDNDGEANFPYIGPFNIEGYLNAAPYWNKDIFTGYGENGVTQANFVTIANYCMKSVIRTTAGLLYWFIAQTGQIPPIAPSNLSISTNLPGNPVTGYELYRGVTGNLIATVQGTQLNKLWYLYECLDGYPVSFPYNSNGLQTLTGNNTLTLSIRNNNYSYVFCLEDGPTTLFLRTKLKVWNDAGTLWSPEIYITPKENQIGGGCPYIFTYSKDSIGNNRYLPDNNILHRSEFSEYIGKNIRDVYHLIVPPDTIDNQISIQLVETE